MRQTNTQRRLAEETHERGYDYLDVRYHKGHDEATDIVICNREAPTEFAEEGEYLVCVWYEHEADEYWVFDGEGEGKYHYDVTNEVSTHQTMDEAFDVVDGLFADR